MELAETVGIWVISGLFGPDDEVPDHLAMDFELNPGTTCSWISLEHG